MSLPAILAASAALENLNLVALGINHAYDEPPEVLTDLPVAIRFAEPTARMEASDLMGRYNIFHFKIEVHLARGILLTVMQVRFQSSGRIKTSMPRTFQ